MQILTVKNIEYFDDFFVIDYGDYKEKINYENVFEMYFYSYDRDNEIYKRFKEIHDSLPDDDRIFSKEQNKEICNLLLKNNGFKDFIFGAFSQNAFILDENKKIKIFNSDKLGSLSCELYFNNELVGSAMLENRDKTINWHPGIKEKFRGKGIGISFYKTVDEFAKMQKKRFYAKSSIVRAFL